MRIPGKATISNRTSTMASQFARARAPYRVPSQAEFQARYSLLEIDPCKPTCVYCGGPPTEWDHLMPMVVASQWTGYGTEIANLVPACGKCNQSRGSKPVAAWMRSIAPWSPRLVFARRDGMTDAMASAEVDRRIAVIERAVTLQPPRRSTVLADDPLEQELERCRLELNALLFRAEAIATRLRQRYSDS